MSSDLSVSSYVCLQDDVRSQDSVFVLGGACGGKLGQELVWKFTQENWDLLHSRYSGGFLLSRLVSVSVTFIFLSSFCYWLHWWKGLHILLFSNKQKKCVLMQRMCKYFRKVLCHKLFNHGKLGYVGIVILDKVRFTILIGICSICITFSINWGGNLYMIKKWNSDEKFF